ncbi:ATP-binding cassette domain-containing protein [Veillonella caviae]|uniref:ATP-binding cassette domain-containing protein n=1 Tax=Veillonella caviae TaxID=248316 RepID=UPI002A9199F5|nr:ATP-binding cassette domain-containing protein [Veillonella caviae]MDY5253551.1 ATP-binding cassette domain-containing protein [Veillonella caviae]
MDTLFTVLWLCQLHHLVDRIDEVANWGQLLSLGEQQRVSFARLFLLKPDWIFLDESTSALDVDNEARMYELLRILCPQATIVSVAHRLYLRKFHDKELVL